MSEPRLIEPLLTEYIMGEPISDHNGVRCCPAMLKDSDQKYIVKIISIPANSSQLDALLLSGACLSKDDALRYFRELADEAVAEAEILQKLSHLEGFRSYDAWQIEPMEDGTGFDLYLLAPYGQTLARYLRRNCLTHLAAVNLGLDLCAALSVCRRSGWLYVDLKPENIYLTDNKGYLIGDLGFLRLSSLKYASLPEKYRSAYTPPEIEDAYSSLNSTMDIYAVGLILYQVYHNGQLPKPGEPISPPEFADSEMAEIILKACAPDPADRWQDPQEMGQALAGYMQRNIVNDDPIIPPVPPVDPEPVAPDEPEEILMEETGEILIEQTDAEHASQTPPEGPESDEPMSEAVVETSQTEPFLEPEVEESYAEEAVSEVLMETDSMELPPEQLSEESGEMEQIVIEGFLFDEESDEDLDISDFEDAPISDEVSQMLAQADELIAHKAPDPVVAPEPIDVPIPEPITPEPEPEPEIITSADPDQPAQELSEPEAEAADADPVVASADEPSPKRRRWLGWLIAAVIVIVLLIAAGLGGKYYYENEYLQNVDSITLESAEDWLTVILDTDIDNSLLSVTCTDTYGNKLVKKVENNQASFTDLPSGTAYKITVTISGRHQLTGNTTAAYTTPSQTSIIGLTGITGDSDGSVILNFSVQGPDASSWLVKYVTDGEEERTVTCSGHMALITGLTPGKTYTFRLVTQDDLYVVAGDTLQFTASNAIVAENLTIHGFEGGALIADWQVPEGQTVDSWTVRCYNGSGVDLTFTTTEPFIAIEGLDISQSYTLDVVASGMTVSKLATISANSISMKDILLDASVSGQLSVSWDFEGTAPAEGWSLIYTVDAGAPISVTCDKNLFVLTDLIPGAHYTFELLLPSGISVFGSTTADWNAPEAKKFSGYGVNADDMLFQLCRAPQVEDWSWQDVADEDFTSDFLTTDSAGLIIRLTKEYETSPQTVSILFVIRDQSGAVVSMTHCEQSWTSMWYQGYCELDLPALPAAAGSYTVQLYLDGAFVTAEPIPFTVS